MKQPIKWHEECLKNMRASLERKLQEIERHNQDADRLKQEVQFLSEQIQAAILAKKDGFDSEKYLHKKPTKPTP